MTAKWGSWAAVGVIEAKTFAPKRDDFIRLAAVSSDPCAAMKASIESDHRCATREIANIGHWSLDFSRPLEHSGIFRFLSLSCWTCLDLSMTAHLKPDWMDKFVGGRLCSHCRGLLVFVPDSIRSDLSPIGQLMRIHCSILAWNQYAYFD